MLFEPGDLLLEHGDVEEAVEFIDALAQARKVDAGEVVGHGGKRSFRDQGGGGKDFSGRGSVAACLRPQGSWGWGGFFLGAGWLRGEFSGGWGGESCF